MDKIKVTKDSVKVGFLRSREDKFQAAAEEKEHGLMEKVVPRSQSTPGGPSRSLFLQNEHA